MNPLDHEALGKLSACPPLGGSVFSNVITVFSKNIFLNMAMFAEIMIMTFSPAASPQALSMSAVTKLRGEIFTKINCGREMFSMESLNHTDYWTLQMKWQD